MNSHKYKQRILTSETKYLRNKDMTHLFTDKKASPLVLMQLSAVEYERYKPNCIHVTGGYHETQKSKRDRVTRYSSIEYGSNVKRSRRNMSVDSEGKCKFNEINLSEMKGNMVMITTNTHEAIRLNKDAMFVDTFSKGNSIASGIVVLCIVVFDKKKDELMEEWDQIHHDKLRSCRNNIVVNGKSNHFNSTGYGYSFGNKGFYGMINNSSVSTYAHKKYKNTEKMEDSIFLSRIIDNMTAIEVNYAVTTMKQVLPNIVNLISPVLDVAYNLQYSIGDINLQKVSGTSDGVWHKQVSINATTSQFHTEKDVTYTMVSVPRQKTKGKTCDMRKDTVFLFQFNKKHNIGILMKQKISFVFSADMLTHRQSCDQVYACDKRGNTTQPFFNVLCYGNERLYNHIRKSLGRMNLK